MVPVLMDIHMVFPLGKAGTLSIKPSGVECYDVKGILLNRVSWGYVFTLITGVKTE